MCFPLGVVRASGHAEVEVVVPVWGYDSNGNWIMLNQAQFLVYQHAQRTKTNNQRRDGRARRHTWLGLPYHR